MAYDISINKSTLLTKEPVDSYVLITVRNGDVKTTINATGIKDVLYILDAVEQVHSVLEDKIGDKYVDVKSVFKMLKMLESLKGDDDD